ncbi:hypothetical protein ACN47E_007895 [Coniothyrium glycines]
MTASGELPGGDPSNMICSPRTRNSTTENMSLFGSGTLTPPATPAKDLKRKATDPNLEIVTIDALYDLTLIVGTPEHIRGQKAFRVSKSSVRHASTVWSSMLNGQWAESDMSEIGFPDDSCDAFQLVLQIAHWQFETLPKTMSRPDLLEMAVLGDKYDLEKILHAAAQAKGWIPPRGPTSSNWPADADLQDWIIITRAFSWKEDCAYMTNKLAMQIEVLDGVYSYTFSGGQKHTMRPDFPPHTLAQIDETRNKILQELLQSCKTAVTIALNNKVMDCHQSTCPFLRVGILMRAFAEADLYPFPEHEFALHGSVLKYWTAIKETSAKYEELIPKACRTTKIVYRAGRHITEEKTCYLNLANQEHAKSILKRYAHGDVWMRWETDKTV